MDEIDKEILSILENNSRISASFISNKVNLSIPAVTDRIKKLEQNKIVKKYTLRLNKMHLGFHLTAFIFVSLTPSANIYSFRNKISLIPNVIECHHVAGNCDYILKVYLRNTNELEDFLMKKLKTMKEVASSNTTIVLSSIKDSINGEITDIL